MTEKAVAVDLPGVHRGSYGHHGERFDHAGFLALVAMAGAVQFSIAVAQILLTVVLICWLGVLITRHERIEVPHFFWPLIAYGGATLASAALSPDPRTSLMDCKQLVLFLIVPLTYRFVGGRRGAILITVLVSCAAASAVVGIVQYGILHFDTMGRRPQGTLGHYMTYAGLLMLVIGVATARVLFGKGERTWAALVLPALAVAVALTETRSAWVGACATVALLLILKDFRLLAVLPILAAVFFAIAPGMVTKRFVSIFDLKDATNRDRIAMLHIGEQMVEAHPVTGVGPNMVEPLYGDYRGRYCAEYSGCDDAVKKVNPHLHNVPVQIAAERGLPALGLWIWFVVALLFDLSRRFYAGGDGRFLAAAALAAVIGMLTAGLFEYNFGDSEFLMLFLVLVTLPAAAGRTPSPNGVME
jgi:O-antigen ligase